MDAVIMFGPLAGHPGLDAIRRGHPGVVIREFAYEEPMEVRLARGRGEPIPAGLRPPVEPSLVTALATADVVLAFDVPSDLGRLAPGLRWMQQIAAGTDHLHGTDLPAGLLVTNAAGISAVPIAEFVMGRLLAVWKRFGELDAAQREHRWSQRYGRRFAGSTVAIIGLGTIGTEVATRAKAFGANVVGIRRRADLPPPDGVDEVHPPAALHLVLARADAVVVAAPASDDTRNLFDAAAFAAMAPGTVFCNVGRGSLVDEPALIDALRSGHVRAAILDVTVNEPLPEHDPLWDAPNVLLSAHCSTVVSDYLDQLADLFADNLRRFEAGTPLRNVVER